MKTEQENGDYDDTVSHSRSEYTETEYEEYKRFYKNDTLALYTTVLALQVRACGPDFKKYFTIRKV